MRPRSGRIHPDDLSGGTFTITNLGMFGVEGFTPIINLPECCILGVGQIVRKPVVVDEDDTLAVRPMMTISLVFDHRVIDGAPGSPLPGPHRPTDRGSVAVVGLRGTASPRQSME